MPDEPLLQLSGIDDSKAILSIYGDRVEYRRSERRLFAWPRHSSVRMAYRDIERAIFRQGPLFGTIRLEARGGQVINMTMIPLQALARAEKVINGQLARARNVNFDHI